jgi:hypothetical protein
MGFDMVTRRRGDAEKPLANAAAFQYSIVRAKPQSRKEMVSFTGAFAALRLCAPKFHKASQVFKRPFPASPRHRVNQSKLVQP